MMDSSDRPRPLSEVAKSSNNSGDDASDITPTSSRKVKGNQQKMVEKVLRFRFVPQDRADEPIHPRTIHIQWLHEVQEALGKDIVIFDNKGRKVQKIDHLRWTHENHEKIFDLHTQSSQSSSNRRNLRTSTGREQTGFIVHRIQSNWTLSEIKSLTAVNKLLRDYQVYLTEHRWCETVWNTTQSGFMVGLDPQFYDADQAAARITQDIKKAVAGRAKIPPFRMAFCTPVVSNKGSNQSRARTKAYAIETEKVHGMEMLKLLKTTYKDTGEFIPFQMRTKYPEAFTKAIKLQTKMLTENRTIVLNNVGTDAILYLSNWIEAIDGVEDLVPYRTVETDGRFRILVKQRDFHRVRNILIKSLTQWFEDHVAPDAKPARGQFPGDPEVAPISTDGYSSGEDSYMASSVNTLMSYDDKLFGDDSLNEEVNGDKSNSSNKPQNRNAGQSLSANSNQAAVSWADRVSKGGKSNTRSSENINEDVLNEEVQAATSAMKTDLEQRNVEVEMLKEEVRNLQREREQYKTDLDSQVREKVSQAIQEHFANNQNTQTVTPNQFETLLAHQTKQFQDFSLQIFQMIASQSNGRMQSANGPGTITSAGKRSVETNGETSSMTDSYADIHEERKRQDMKLTPQKLNFSNAVQQSLPPSPSQLDLSPTSENNFESMVVDNKTETKSNSEQFSDTITTASEDTAPSTERREAVNSSNPASKPGTRFPWEDPSVTLNINHAG